MMYSELTSTLSVRSTFHLLSWPLLYSTLLYSTLWHTHARMDTRTYHAWVYVITRTQNPQLARSLSLSDFGFISPHTLSSFLISLCLILFLSYFLSVCVSHIPLSLSLSLSLFISLSLYLSLLPLTPRWAGEVTPLLIRSSATAIKSS